MEKHLSPFKAILPHIETLCEVVVGNHHPTKVRLVNKTIWFSLFFISDDNQFSDQLYLKGTCKGAPIKNF